jgi:hypothetical protein
MAAQQASRCYDLCSRTYDVLSETVEQRDVLGSQNEYSDVVWEYQDSTIRVSREPSRPANAMVKEGVIRYVRSVPIS